MTNDEFQRLAALYGFAPSRALRELVDAAVAAEREACAVAGGAAADAGLDVAAAIRARGQA